MTRRRSRVAWSLAVLLSLIGVTFGHRSIAQGTASPLKLRPFIEHRVALQLSDTSTEKQAFILSMANKMLETYGPDRIDIQVVAMGPGIQLLQLDNPNRDRVDSLIAQGVTFNVCGYTLDTIERETGRRPKMNPKAVQVAGGGPFLLSLSEKQYTIIRP